MLKKILIGLFCLEASMAVHEGAHFVLMRAYGVEVEEMSIGIGPVLYQKQFPEFKFSVRLIPIMAYVAPSKKGVETETALPLLPIILIDLAGVFSNLLLASLVFLGLKLRESSPSWLVDFLFLPKNYFLLFKDLLVSMVTFGVARPQNNGALILERQPGFFWQYLFLINLILGLANLLPVQMLDGGKVFFLFFATGLGMARDLFGISEKTLLIVAQVVNFVTFYMLIVLMLKSLQMQFIRIVNLNEQNKTP